MTINNNYIEYLDSKFGTLEVCADQYGVTSIIFVQDKCKSVNCCLFTQQAVDQLDEYFAGKRTEFNLNLNAQGTAFQHQVWQELRTIQYGQICS